MFLPSGPFSLNRWRCHTRMLLEVLAPSLATQYQLLGRCILPYLTVAAHGAPTLAFGRCRTHNEFQNLVRTATVLYVFFCHATPRARCETQRLKLLCSSRSAFTICILRSTFYMPSSKLDVCCNSMRMTCFIDVAFHGSHSMWTVLFFVW